MTNHDIFPQLALILSVASVLSFICYRFKLPLVVAYLITGVGIAVAAPQITGHDSVLHFLPELGIALVLFLIGMELDLREIRSLGKPIIVAAIGQIVIASIGAYAIASLLKFGQAESLFLGIGMSFSSTVVVVKMLLEKKELTSLYGKLAIGILLIEDLVAIVILMGLSVGSSALGLGLQQALPILTLVIKAIGLFVLTFILSRFVLERVFKSVAKSVELLFLTAIAWCFMFTTLAIFAGFSVVIGAFLAGVALASSPYHLQIQGKIKPLRDFFVTLFFVYLGTQVRLSDLQAAIIPAIVLTAFSLTIKPLIFLLLLGNFGFRKHTMFQTSLTLSQISEFALIIMLVGASSGAVGSLSMTVIALVAVISIIISSVMITYSKYIYKIVRPWVGFFEHSSKVWFWEDRHHKDLSDHVVLIGAHRVGGPVLEFLIKERIPVIVVEFNPHLVEELADEKVNVIYGDASDPEILEHLNLNQAKLIISTATDPQDTLMLLSECKVRRLTAYIVVRSLDQEHVAEFKRSGADFVITPETVSGEYIVDKIRNHWLKSETR